MSGSTVTPNYGYTLPTIGGDQNVWGNELNANWTKIDSDLHSLVIAAGGVAAGALPTTGGTITGPLAVNSSLTANSLGVSGTTSTGNLGVSGSTNLNSLSVAGNAAFAGTTDFVIYRSGSQRIIQWSGGVTEAFDTSTSVFYWNMSGVKMNLDGSGDLTIAGAGIKPGGGLWQASSDDRVKRDASPYGAGLQQVCELRPIAFRYNGQGDTEADGKTYYGLSAQATQPVMPELVHEKKGFLLTDLGPLVVALVNCVRELRDRVVALEGARG